MNRGRNQFGSANTVVRGLGGAHGDERHPRAAEVEVGEGHAAACNSARAASRVRLSSGKSPVSKREMLDCVRPSRAAISACDMPRALRISAMLSIRRIYAHTHENGND